MRSVADCAFRSVRSRLASVEPTATIHYEIETESQWLVEVRISTCAILE